MKTQKGMVTVKINIEKKLITVTAVRMANKISVISVVPSITVVASCTPSRDAQIAQKRNVALNNKVLMIIGRVTVSIAYAEAIPNVLFALATPAVTVFIASPTEDPIIGIIFDAANFIPRREALSLLAAKVPLSAINARRNAKVNAITEMRFFFMDLVIPRDFNDGERHSDTNKHNTRDVKGKR